MKSSLRFQIILFAIIRLVFNTIYRMVYPFLAVFSRGLGVDLMTLSLAMTNRSLVGMLGAFLATISDRWGRKTGMLFGIILFVIGAGVLAIWPSYPGFVVMLILTTYYKCVAVYHAFRTKNYSNPIWSTGLKRLTPARRQALALNKR